MGLLFFATWGGSLATNIGPRQPFRGYFSNYGVKMARQGVKIYPAAS